MDIKILNVGLVILKGITGDYALQNNINTASLQEWLKDEETAKNKPLTEEYLLSKDYIQHHGDYYSHDKRIGLLRTPEKNKWNIITYPKHLGSGVPFFTQISTAGELMNLESLMK